MRISLRSYQSDVLSLLCSGSILKAGVGAGKSRTILAYFFAKELRAGHYDRAAGEFITEKISSPKDLVIITTARKRDNLEWDEELVKFGLYREDVNESGLGKIRVSVDSWNNVGKYVGLKDAFFVFDEQHLVGSGAWVKSFYKIAAVNHWVIVTGTPGDTWLDYIPVFIANGFYRNRTDFLRQHAVFSRYTKYPKIDRFIGEEKLRMLRDSITVEMDYKPPTVRHRVDIRCDYDLAKYNSVQKDRWNPWEGRPIKNVSEYFYCIRRVVNEDQSRADKLWTLINERKRLIVFYNFDYELDILHELRHVLYRGFEMAEWNGHVHQPIPTSTCWVYLVQYTAGSEAWNCTATDSMCFYSLNYSYKVLEQSEGRIDRMNTPYRDLNYYYMISDSKIDKKIRESNHKKKTFNERNNLVYFVTKSDPSFD